jgi:excinuclease ABC subunit A
LSAPRVDGEIIELQDPKNAPALKKTFNHNIEAIVDRIVLKPEIRSRLADSVETALKLSQGLVIIAIGQPGGNWVDQVYSEKFACPVHPNVSLPELEPRLFSFNSPHGACPECHGLGTINEFDPELIVNDESLSMENGAVEAWRKNGKRMNIFYSRVLRQFARDFNISYTGPYKDVPKKVRDILMYGTDAKGDNGSGTYFEGVIPNLQRRFENTESEWVKTKLHTYMSDLLCPACCGTRLKKEALAVRLHTLDGHESTPDCSNVDIEHEKDAYGIPGNAAIVENGNGPKHAKKPKVKLPGYSIDDVARMTVGAAKDFFEKIRLGEEGQKDRRADRSARSPRASASCSTSASPISRSIARPAPSAAAKRSVFVSRRRSAPAWSASATSSTSPTIGLHQRDNTRLIRTLHRLRDIGNTVIMVEHDEDCIRASDYLIDIGPGAGAHGGNVVVTGIVQDLLKKPASFNSTTLKYLTGEYSIKTPEHRRPVDPDKNCLELKGARENNLKNVDVKIPLGGFICVTGVSGLRQIHPRQPDAHPGAEAQAVRLEGQSRRAQVTGGREQDRQGDRDRPVPDRPHPAQQPRHLHRRLRRDPKSVRQDARSENPRLRSRPILLQRQRRPLRSLPGPGTKCIEMHFLPDVYVNCEVCHGTRYNAETLEIHYRGKNIAEVLAMTVEEAMNFLKISPSSTAS